ncbi:hypothetical protein F5148DRAFT_483126 [Russula earlei]|uniref:Uncharacterized protein n=1 Tax=Russula earlei TaxID=71964 RepID=A0ACC0TY38_9AGAM|nr:hypothetical protein F5148DRAFT_483126 [Russula earlei]
MIGPTSTFRKASTRILTVAFLSSFLPATEASCSTDSQGNETCKSDAGEVVGGIAIVIFILLVAVWIRKRRAAAAILADFQSRRAAEEAEDARFSRAASLFEPQYPREVHVHIESPPHDYDTTSGFAQRYWSSPQNSPLVRTAGVGQT